jgi:type II secretory pathway pseudopilin PulG
MERERSPRGLTRLEVGAILAVTAGVLTAGAPTLKDAHGRTSLSQVRDDFGLLAQALEAYQVDWNAYPPCNNFGLPGRRTSEGDADPRDRVLERLSTPVAYLTDSFLPDPFEPDQALAIALHSQLPGVPFPVPIDEAPQWQAHKYTSWDDVGRTVVPINDGSFTDHTGPGRSWLLQSSGPDGTYFAVGGILANFASGETLDIIYDPTNGLVSYGAIFDVGGTLSTGHGRGFTLGVRHALNFPIVLPTGVTYR